MQYLKILFILCIGVALLCGCGGTKKKPLTPPATEERIENIPEEWQNKPEDPNYIYGQGTSTSRDLQIAMDKAKESGRLDIAKTLETKFQSLTKRFQEEVGTGMDSEILDQFTQTTKSVTSQVLIGTKVYKTWPLEEEGLYRIFILMELPLGEANQALLNQIKANQNMYTRFRSTQAFQEMDEEVKKYEEWKAQQGQVPGQ